MTYVGAIFIPKTVISRLRIGHTRLTHSFILKQELQSQYLTYQTTCTVKHILIECKAFAVIRKRFFKVNSLTDLFENIKIDDVLSFLRETGLYQKIWLQRLICYKNQPTNQKYDELKLVNHVQANEILLMKFLPTKYLFRNVRLNVYKYKQNLALNILQRLVCHKNANNQTNQILGFGGNFCCCMRKSY